MARARNQPTFDFIIGTELSPAKPQQQNPLRESLFKQSTTVSNHNNEDLRAQLRTLQYELDSVKQERELVSLQHQSEVRDVQSRAEADFKRAQVAESAANAATKKCETIGKDFKDAQDRATNEKASLEKKIRGLQEDNRALREELEDAQAELSENGRRQQHAYAELEQKYDSLRSSVGDIQTDLSAKVNTLQSTQQRLSAKETEVGELEKEVIRLKAQTGDVDTLAVVKKELIEQVEYIRKLEGANREHLAELKQYRKTAKSVEVVEEEKRALEARVRMMDDMRKELGEAQLQKRILEDEKMEWTSYLQSQGGAIGDDGEPESDMNFETPEQMARAFLQERLERLSLVDKLGTVQPELTVKDENIRGLEEDMAKLRAELEKMRSAGLMTPGSTAGTGDAKARARLERQKNLAIKEVEYLRAQMKTFEAEEAEFSPEHVDEERSKRIHELEHMVEQYRSELNTLQADLSKLETQSPSTPTLSSPRKRTREEEAENEAASTRLGELTRKMRTLQDSLTKLQTRNQVLEGELKASLAQLTTLKKSSRTRTLEFRNNPTAQAEAIKMSTLRTLQEENTALLSQLEGAPHSTKVVPISTLHSARQQLEDLKTQLAQHEKKTLRLKQIWSAKALEFREAVASILGWKLDFMPNGRVKVTSILHPTTMVDGEEEENSIVFDGENGTMKVSGGTQSVFAQEIKTNLEFWVTSRQNIPCFLGACQLEFYEAQGTTRAGGE